MMPSPSAPDFGEIAALERPDLILAGRDHDLPFLGELRDDQPALARSIASGPRWMAEIIQDKWESHLFCLRWRLPFADTWLTGDGGGAREFAEKHGYPLIAKPRYGYGTLGVRILFDESQLARTAAQPDFVIQPFLAPPPGLRGKFFDPADGWPLFHALVDDGQYAGQAIIGPTGELHPEVWCHRCTMIAGKAEASVPHPDAAFQEITRRFARAASADGWRGPFNLQCRRLADGSYVGFEMSGRITGTTSSRRLFGFDEVGLLARLFAGYELPLALPPVARTGPGMVAKYLSDYYVPDAWVRELQTARVWHAPRSVA